MAQGLHIRNSLCLVSKLCTKFWGRQKNRVKGREGGSMGKGDLSLIPESQILGDKQLLQIVLQCHAVCTHAQHRSPCPNAVNSVNYGKTRVQNVLPTR